MVKSRQLEKEAAVETRCQKHLAFLQPQPGPKGFKELDDFWLQQVALLTPQNVNNLN